MTIEEIVKEMINNGMDIEIVSKILNIDIEEIKVLTSPNK